MEYQIWKSDTSIMCVLRVCKKADSLSSHLVFHLKQLVSNSALLRILYGLSSYSLVLATVAFHVNFDSQ